MNDHLRLRLKVEALDVFGARKVEISMAYNIDGARSKRFQTRAHMATEKTLAARNTDPFI